MAIANRDVEQELTRLEKIGVATFITLVVAIMLVGKMYH
jgi:hypothetical protein